MCASHVVFYLMFCVSYTLFIFHCAVCFTCIDFSLRVSGFSIPVPWCFEEHTHTQTRLPAIFPGLPRPAAIRKVKLIWILLKQETVSGIGISWAVCKSPPCSRQITMPAPQHSVFIGQMPFLSPTNSVIALCFKEIYYVLVCMLTW